MESELPPLPPTGRAKPHRRRGKGKGKGLLTPPSSSSHASSPPSPPASAPPTKKQWVTPKQLESDIWEDETFKSYVDSADPKAMELLIRDLALALPVISEQIVERKQSDLSTSFNMVLESASPDLRPRGLTWRDRATSLDVLSTAVARSVVDDGFDLFFPPLAVVPAVTTPPVSQSADKSLVLSGWMEDDPERQVRVALVVEMAENERIRRREEMEHITWKDRLQIATRIEWALLANNGAFQLQQEEQQERQRKLAEVKLEEETERQRRMEATLPDEVSLSLTDYEVICPYNSLGCEAVLRRSELPQHFDVCVFRAEVREANRLALVYEQYNPLDHIIVCPYAVVGCRHSCRRQDLPQHLATCPQRGESRLVPRDSPPVYEVICPYATKGCAHTCELPQLADHLLQCSHAPRNSVEEQAERAQFKLAAIMAEEEERARRASVPEPTEPQHHYDRSQHKLVLKAIVKPSSWSRDRNEKVQWVKKAAEIEKMRREEEKLAMGGSEVKAHDALPPPGRRQIVLEMALRRQKLHHANWYPAQTLQFEGRRTHVAQFHNHLEQQTQTLHRTLHDEIERFGRDCALWELETKDQVSERIDNIRIVVESCWQKYVSITKPTLHIFGSFASELSVPGVSDLDLVVVPGEETVAMDTGDKIKQLIKDRLEAARRCQIIGEALSNCPDFLHNVRVIATASVPLVTMRTNAFEFQPGRGLDIDLTVALSQHDGVQAAEFVKLLRVRFPPLMPMVRLLKAFLFVRGLANPFLGGLSSYALVLMAAASVMRSFDRAGKAIFLNQGELIVDFLDLFGREFDCEVDAVICSRDAGARDKMGIRRDRVNKNRFIRIGPRQESTCSDIEHVLLVVDDPIRVGNNIGRPCFAFPKVQAAFAEVLASLLSFVVKNQAVAKPGAGLDNSTLLETIFGVRPMSDI